MPMNVCVSSHTHIGPSHDRVSWVTYLFKHLRFAVTVLLCIYNSPYCGWIRHLAWPSLDASGVVSWGIHGPTRKQNHQIGFFIAESLLWCGDVVEIIPINKCIDIQHPNRLGMLIFKLILVRLEQNGLMEKTICHEGIKINAPLHHCCPC